MADSTRDEAKGHFAIYVALIEAIALIISALIGYYGNITSKETILILQQQNDESQATISSLQRENTALQAEKSDTSVVQGENVSLQERIAELEQENSSLQTQIATLQETNSSLETNYTAVLAQLAEIGETPKPPVESDSGTQKAGKTEDKPDVWLSDLDYFDSDGGWEIGTVTKDNRGDDHSHSLNYTSRGWGYRVYNLDAHYSRMRGMFYQEYDVRSGGGGATLCIYGDDELLWQGAVERGVQPLSFDVSLDGVMKLTIQLKDHDYIWDVAIGEVGLWY